MRAVQGYGFRCYEIFPWAVTYMLSFNSYHVNNSLKISEGHAKQCFTITMVAKKTFLNGSKIYGIILTEEECNFLDVSRFCICACSIL